MKAHHENTDKSSLYGHLKCRAIVVSCIDFRFQKFLREFEDKEIGEDGYDFMGFAGGVKNIDLVLEEVEISKRLHDIREVYLVNHEECGAYGKDSNLVTHKRDLLNAKNKIKEKFPDLFVFTYYLRLNGEFEEIR